MLPSAFFTILNNIVYLPMVCCFIMFFANDMYGFFNWRSMQKRQEQL